MEIEETRTLRNREIREQRVKAFEGEEKILIAFAALQESAARYLSRRSVKSKQPRTVKVIAGQHRDLHCAQAV